MNRGRWKSAALTVSLCSALLAPGMAAAQVDAGRAQTAAFDIALPAQPLAQALAEVARQTNTTLVADPGLLQGRTAPPINGRMTAGQAYERLLAGSGLTAAIDGSTVVVRRLAASPGEPQSRRESTLAPVQVTGKPEPARDGRLPPHAGGQVARGGSVGMLGNVDLMDTPFNVTSYTSRTFQDQQSRYLSDFLVRNDPSVRVWGGEGDSTDTLRIRGFDLNMDEVSFNGLPGLLAQYRSSGEFIERLEVFRGPGAMFKGMSPSGASGGGVNIVSKRADDRPLTRLTGSFLSDSRFGLHADVGRRFGPENEWGIRVNGVARSGDTPRDNQTESLRVGSLAIDYSGRRLRASLDHVYQNTRDLSARTVLNSYNVVPGVALPAPDGKTNYGQPWSRLISGTRTTAARVEYDLQPELTAYLAAGQAESWHWGKGGNIILTSAAGDTRQAAAGSQFLMDTVSAETGLRGRFRTGSVGHRWSLAVSHLKRDSKFGSTPAVATFLSNIYSPVYYPEPPGITEATAQTYATTRLPGVGLADTMSMLDDRLLLTLGVRWQRVETDNVAAGAITSSYKESAVTPLAGVVFKGWERGSLYANYAEGLAQGGTAPLTAANPGETLAPFKSKQVEVGVKQEWGSWGATVSLFQIKKTTGLLDPASNVFGAGGEQRNRGLEVNLFGEVVRGVRLLGGAAWTDAEIVNAAPATSNGKRPIGVPVFTANLGGEWDVPGTPGITLTAGVIHTGSSYIDSSNLAAAPGWTRTDVGARRATRIGGAPVTFRAMIENLTNRHYWSIGTFGAAYLGLPRTLALSATVDF